MVEKAAAGRIADINNSVVDNALYDPLQGYDADVWAIDQATGNWNLVGRFTSIELVFRNTTRPYVEFNQRVMRQLDGVFMLGWTMERGLLDGRVLNHTFGYSKISRGLRINRHPRMQIVFQLNAPELERSQRDTADKEFEGRFSLSNKSNLSSGVTSGGDGGVTTVKGSNGIEVHSEGDDFIQEHGVKRDTTTMVALTMCKVETFTLRAEAGDEIISNKWEGVAEGYEVLDGTSVWAGHYLDETGAAFAQDALIDRVPAEIGQSRDPYSSSSGNGFLTLDAWDFTGTSET